MKNKLIKIVPLTLGCLLGVGGVISFGSSNKNSEVKADIERYNLFICDVEFTDENLVIDSEDSTSITGGSATFDPATNTLTLDQLNVEGTGYVDVSPNYYYYVISYKGTDLLNLNLKNDNLICSTAVPTNNQPVYAFHSNGPLSITGGEGTSTFIGPVKAYRNYGIYANGSLTIDTEGTINAISREGADEGIIGESAAIYSVGDMTISAGTINATAGTSNGRSYGLFADTNSRTITINGGTVVGTGGQSRLVSAGAMAKYFLMNDGDVTMIASDTENVSTGIYGVNGVIFKKGALTSAGKN